MVFAPRMTAARVVVSVDDDETATLASRIETNTVHDFAKKS